MEVTFECRPCGWIWIEYMGAPVEVRCPCCDEVDTMQYISHEVKDESDIGF
jgi:phage FluMu protein Com